MHPPRVCTRSPPTALDTRTHLPPTASFSQRSGDVISQPGHPDGIAPRLGAEVKFDSVGLITEFNNGPFGGSPNSCRTS
jgi:hypothetical protein